MRAKLFLVLLTIPASALSQAVYNLEFKKPTKKSVERPEPVSPGRTETPPSAETKSQEYFRERNSITIGTYAFEANRSTSENILLEGLELGIRKEFSAHWATEGRIAVVEKSAYETTKGRKIDRGRSMVPTLGGTWTPLAFDVFGYRTIELAIYGYLTWTSTTRESIGYFGLGPSIVFNFAEHFGITWRYYKNDFASSREELVATSVTANFAF